MNKLFRSFYDWIAPIYDVLMKIEAFIDGVRARKERQKFVRLLELKPSSRVLEIGVGTGSNLTFVARQTGTGSTIVGLDLSIPMLAEGRDSLMRKNVPASLTCGNAEHLPFKSNYFDTVYIFGSFNVLADQKRTVREMMRVARPEALVVISDKSLAGYQEHDIREKLTKFLDPESEEPPPVEIIPLPDNRIQIGWLWNKLIYVLKFHNQTDIQKS